MQKKQKEAEPGLRDEWLLKDGIIRNLNAEPIPEVLSDDEDLDRDAGNAEDEDADGDFQPQPIPLQR